MNPLQRRRLLEIRAQQLAREVYESFTPNERRGVAFGLFPDAKMTPAQDKFLEEWVQAEGREPSTIERAEVGRLLAVAVMDVPHQKPNGTVH